MLLNAIWDKVPPASTGREKVSKTVENKEVIDFALCFFKPK